MSSANTVAPAKHFRHFILDDLACEPFGDGRLADARVADQQGIVLLTAAKHLDGALHFSLATDQRIDAFRPAPCG